MANEKPGFSQKPGFLFVFCLSPLRRLHGEADLPRDDRGWLYSPLPYPLSFFVSLRGCAWIQNALVNRIHVTLPSGRLRAPNSHSLRTVISSLSGANM